MNKQLIQVHARTREGWLVVVSAPRSRGDGNAVSVWGWPEGMILNADGLFDRMNMKMNGRRCVVPLNPKLIIRCHKKK